MLLCWANYIYQNDTIFNAIYIHRLCSNLDSLFIISSMLALEFSWHTIWFKYFNLHHNKSQISRESESIYLIFSIVDSHHPGFERNTMLPYFDMQEAEAALGRELSFAEKLWFNYSAKKHDYFLHFHNFIFLLFFYSLVPLPYLLAELSRSKKIHEYKIQPKVKRSFSDMFNCYKNVMQVFLLVAGPLQIIAFSNIKVGQYNALHNSTICLNFNFFFSKYKLRMLVTITQIMSSTWT